MSNLPKRKHFKLEDAVEYLECAQSDIQYYLQEGCLRYAVPCQAFEGFALVAIASLPEATQKTLAGLIKPDLLRCHDIGLIVDESVQAIPLPEHLYFKHADRARYYVTEDDGVQVRAHLLELFDGTPVSLWLLVNEDQRMHVLTGAYIGSTDADGCPAESVLTREELDRMVSAPVHSIVSQPVVVNQLINPFKLPQKANDIAIAMCEYGNSYSQKYGKVPSVVELLNHMLKDVEKLGMVAGAEKGMYFFNGVKLKERQFKERYGKYLSE